MSIRVLLVDDHPAMRAGLRSVIDGQPDMTVLGEAEDGTAAVEAVRDQAPDVVVMDASMPGLSGIEATRRIVTDRPEVRVVCFSLHAEEHLVAAMLEAGASGYVLKDAAPFELAEAIRVVAARKAYLSPTVSGAVIRDSASPRSERAAQPHLTTREQEVLQLIAEAHDTADIAERLCISTKTVATHREHIMAKLDLHNVVALTKYAIRKGIVTVQPDSD